MNIPSDANKTNVGVQRMSARSVFEQGGYIVPLKSPTARYAVFLDDVPMFWLVKSVTIPPRLEMHKSTEDEIPTLLSNLSSILGKEYKK